MYDMASYEVLAWLFAGIIGSITFGFNPPPQRNFEYKDLWNGAIVGWVGLGIWLYFEPEKMVLVFVAASSGGFALFIILMRSPKWREVVINLIGYISLKKR